MGWAPPGSRFARTRDFSMRMLETCNPPRYNNVWIGLYAKTHISMFCPVQSTSSRIRVFSELQENIWIILMIRFFRPYVVKLVASETESFRLAFES
jgi:hypothetical protein